MSAPTKVTADTAKLPLMLTALRLPTFANLWPAFADRADGEGWPAQPGPGRSGRVGAGRAVVPHPGLREAMGKTSKASRGGQRCKAHVRPWPRATLAGNNILAFGPPGGGKSHWRPHSAMRSSRRRVLFTRTDLVQRLQTARQNLTLAQDVAKLTSSTC